MIEQFVISVFTVVAPLLSFGVIGISLTALGIFSCQFLKIEPYSAEMPCDPDKCIFGSFCSKHWIGDGC
jgi:hypothetical protein